MRVEILPGRLCVDIMDHLAVFGEQGYTFLSYLSDGLHALGQREVALTFLASAAVEEQLEAPLPLLETLYAYALEGLCVDVGDTTELSQGDLMGRPGLRGALYVDPQPLPGLPLPHSRMTMLLLSEDELRIARHFGAGRVLARMGHNAGHFPFPGWNDLDRAPAFHAESELETVLAACPRLIVRRAHIALEHNRRLILDLPRHAQREIAEAAERWHPEDETMALIGMPHPGADAWLVWAPGQEAPQATCAKEPCERFGGGFALFSLEQAPRLEVLEDGFCCAAPLESIAAVRDALLGDADAEVSLDPSCSVCIQWI